MVPRNLVNLSVHQWSVEESMRMAEGSLVAMDYLLSGKGARVLDLS